MQRDLDQINQLANDSYRKTKTEPVEPVEPVDPVVSQTSKTNSIDHFKYSFLNRYNPERTEEKAIELSIKAAVQHNSLYSKSASNDDRKVIRHVWAEALRIISEKYKSEEVSDEIYLADIIELKDLMNNQYSDYFMSETHPKFNYDPGFRISHSQKSIGVYLKHLWCLGEIKAPPQCPVDAIILKVAGQKYPNTKWTHINSIDEHLSQVEILSKMAGDLPLPEWELKSFNTS